MLQQNFICMNRWQTRFGPLVIVCQHLPGAFIPNIGNELAVGPFKVGANGSCSAVPSGGSCSSVGGLLLLVCQSLIKREISLGDPSLTDGLGIK